MVALAVVVLLRVESSHLECTVAACGSLCISAMAFHKKTEELRAIGIDRDSTKCCARSLDECKNTLAFGYWVTSTSLNANLAINDSNKLAHAAGCACSYSSTQGCNLIRAQIILNVPMALTFAVDRSSGLKGIVSKVEGRRGEKLGNSLVEDTQLGCQKIGSIMGIMMVGHEQGGEVHINSRQPKACFSTIFCTSMVGVKP